jgi:hypothetical protein
MSQLPVDIKLSPFEIAAQRLDPVLRWVSQETRSTIERSLGKQFNSIRAQPLLLSRLIAVCMKPRRDADFAAPFRERRGFGLFAAFC